MAAIMFILLSAALPYVLAEHEPSHRYFISGYLTQEDGSPACGVAVEASGRRATSDYRGWYRIQLHMHDATVDPVSNDVGTYIEVRIVDTSIVKTTTAVPSDIEDGWGESRVDFVVPAGLSRECVNPLVQAGIYAGVPLAAVAGLSIAYLKVLRPWWTQRSIGPSLSSITGIGRARLQELNRMGIRTLEDLAQADPAEIARQTSIGKKEAKRLVRRAREKLEEGST